MDEKIRQCGIIEDLIPSYVDDVLSDSVRNAVEEHLSECTKCQEALEEYRAKLQNAQIESEKTEAAFIKKMKDAKHYLIGMAIGASIPILALVGFILYVVVFTMING